MSEDFGAPAKKSNTTTIIIIVVAVVVLCCCCAGIGLGIYFNLGAISSAIGGFSGVSHSLPLA